VILLQVKLTKLKLQVLKSDFQRKKEDTNTDKLAINWQNFARVRLQLKFAFLLALYHDDDKKVMYAYLALFVNYIYFFIRTIL